MKRLSSGIAAAAVVAMGAHASAQCLHWEKVSESGPNGRIGFGIAYDSKRGVTVLFGGANGPYPDWDHYGDTWEWDGKTWTLVDPGGDESDPVARVEQAMCFDSARGVTVMNGGANVSLPVHHVGGTWEWDGAVWTLRMMDGMLPWRHAHDMVFDTARGRSVAFADKHQVNADTWEWDGNDWYFRGAGGVTNRGWYGMAYDEERGTSVAFGGYTAEFALLGDTLTWDGRAWTEQNPAHSPSPRANPAMAYDSHRRVVVLVAGQSAQGYQGDTWEWDGTDWTKVDIAGPPGRDNHGLVYDSGRRRMVLFGGIRNGETFLGDTWELVSSYADCDGSGSLDIDDFICFQTQFGAGDERADCDQSGGLDIDDFICFQTAYAAGCP